MERIIVPFAKKKRARDLGAIFLKEGERGWFLPDNLSEEIKETLRNLETEGDLDTSGHSYLRQQYQETVSQPLKKQEQENESLPGATPSSNKSTLEMALEVFQKGLPKTEEERTKVLQILGNRSPAQYPITYDGMVMCPDFAKEYPAERLETLIKKSITGARHYSEEIRNADITEEEKALLFFALPL